MPALLADVRRFMEVVSPRHAKPPQEISVAPAAGLGGLAHVYLETVSACDLDCRFCPRVTHKRLRSSALLSDDILARLMPELIRMQRVSLNGLGEPLLDRRMPALVRTLSRAGVVTGLTTNGTLLPAGGVELMEEGISLIALSLDGATEGTQAQLRDGTSVEALFARFALLVEARARLKAATQLAVTTVLSRENVSELPALVTRVARIGGDALLVKNLTFTANPGSAASSFIAEDAGVAGEGGGAAIDEALARAKALGIALTINRNRRHRLGSPPWHCPYHPLTSVFVSVEGLVFPCFVEGERWMGNGGHMPSPNAIGDLRQASLTEIWSHPPASAFRAAFAAGTNPACRDCMLIGEEYRQSTPPPMRAVHQA